MLWLAPRRTPGRLKTGGVPPKPPATIFLSLSPSVFWDFGSLFRTLRRHFLTRCCGSVPRRSGAIQVAHVIQTDPEDLESLTCPIANVWPIPRTSRECCSALGNGSTKTTGLPAGRTDRRDSRASAFNKSLVGIQHHKETSDLGRVLR